ncbi:MAG: cytochrome b/b6 domain-containing protein, partial [Terriglobia bacterium]
MDSWSIPINPVPLTFEQAEAMAQRQIKKHHVAIMLLHWFNAIVWLLELTTGAALISSPHFRIAPLWYIAIVQGFFGSRAHMLWFHIAVGITWIVVFAVYGTFGFRTYLTREVLEREIALDWDDIIWLKVRLLRILGRSSAPLPPQWVYNAGQKLFALLVYAMIPIIMLTGLVMAFHLVSTNLVAWAVVLHFVAVGLVASGLMIHVYMGAVFPEEKPAFFSMITGTVNELYAYRHHYKWWKEVKMQEREWKQGMDGTGGKVAPQDYSPAAAEQPELAEDFTQSRRELSGVLHRVFRKPEYWPPYVAGVGLGLTLLATFILMGEGLGASGGFTRFLVALISWVAPNYVAGNAYWSEYAQPGQSPLMSFLVFELIGVVVGGFVSGWLAHRLRISVDKGPRVSARGRYALA